MEKNEPLSTANKLILVAVKQPLVGTTANVMTAAWVGEIKLSATNIDPITGMAIDKPWRDPAKPLWHKKIKKDHPTKTVSALVDLRRQSGKHMRIIALVMFHYATMEIAQFEVANKSFYQAAVKGATLNPLAPPKLLECYHRLTNVPQPAIQVTLSNNNLPVAPSF